MYYLGPEDEILHGRYARTLMAVAQESGRLDKIAKDIEAASQGIGENKLFAKIFSHPGIGKEDKQKLLEAFSKKAKFCQEFVYFLKLLAQNSRLNIIHGILLRYQDLYNLHKARQKVIVQTAVSLGREQINRLKTILGEILNKDIFLEQVIEPSLLGSFKLRIGNKTYNFSLVNRLKFLEERLKKGRAG